MAPSHKRANPLALAVLVLLFEKPMHPYEMAATLKERGKEDSIKLRYGSLYTLIGQLERDGLIVAAATEREGARPERTTYRLTDAGEAEMRSWLRSLVCEPVKEYPQFEAALSLLPALAPDEVRALLRQRVARLVEQEQLHEAGLREAAAINVPALFIIETEYAVALLRAQRTYLASLIDRIESGALDGIEPWRKWHSGRRGGSSPWLHYPK